MNETVVAICSMIKDEQNYLKEWIEYHLSIGISCIYLYEDDINNSSSHANICKEYQNVYLDKFTNMITLNRRKINRQCELWNAFICKYRKRIFNFYIFNAKPVKSRLGLTQRHIG